MARICIISLNSAGILRGDKDAHIGGVERQTEIMANWFVENGHDVSVLVWSSQGETADSVHNGIDLLRICGRKQGIRGLRFVSPQWTSLISALNRANADVYYHNAAEAMTGKIALWCKMHGRRFVYSVASEAACETTLPTIATALERTLYKFGLRFASAIIVQSSTQKEMLRTNFGVDSVFLPMPCKALGAEITMFDSMSDRKTAIWMGRIVPLKRLELLLEVAIKLSDFRFEVVGGTSVDSPYARSVLMQASRVHNVRVVGAVPHERTWDYYRRSAFLICTSKYEGFPNTFLEAMSLGIPIISTFDPGDILTQHNIGVAVSSVEEIVRAVTDLVENRSYYDAISRNAREYFAGRHNVDAAMPAFESVLTRVLNGKRAA